GRSRARKAPGSDRPVPRQDPRRGPPLGGRHPRRREGRQRPHRRGGRLRRRLTGAAGRVALHRHLQGAMTMAVMTYREALNMALLTLDQIVNSAAKMYDMSGGQFNVPIVIRGPGGPAAQLAAQHSQSMETYFYHVPGLKVVRPTTPMDAKGLLKSSIRDDNPVIFIESETLYNVKGEVPEDPDFLIPLGKAIVRREGTDVTVIA